MNFYDDFLTETLKIYNSNYYILATPFTHLPYHLSLSDLQLLLVLAINIPNSISPKSVTEISLWYSYIDDQQLWIQTKTFNQIKTTHL